MASVSTLATLVKRLNGSRVLCVGDAMVDRYVYGNVDRISPEAPIPVLRIDHETSMLGGAGNVVRNLAALGAKPLLISARGADAEGEELAALLANHSVMETYLVVDSKRRTPVKTRFIAQTQQLLRTDLESVAPLSAATQKTLVAQAKIALERTAVMVLSDYGKGVLTGGVAAVLIAAAQARPVLIDPKGTDYSHYRGATLLTPNQRELAEATGLPTSNTTQIIIAAKHLIETCAAGAILVTRSRDGMTLIQANGTVNHLPAEVHEVFDVSGAGDTVVATLAAALAGGVALIEAAWLANIAAGVVVSKMGTAVASTVDITEALYSHKGLSKGESAAGVVTLEKAVEYVARWRNCGLTIGFTNGCFDLLHPGHLLLLRRARAACDRLVVGLNSDISIRCLKGLKRPVQSEIARAALLSSLRDVDLVVLFSDDTPLALIEAIRPEVLVKGSDYTVESVVGASLVQEYGGKVLFISLEDGFSTTATITKILQ